MLVFQTTCQMSATKNYYRPRKTVRLYWFRAAKKLALNFQIKQPQHLQQEPPCIEWNLHTSILLTALCSEKQAPDFWWSAKQLWFLNVNCFKRLTNKVNYIFLSRFSCAGSKQGTFLFSANFYMPNIYTYKDLFLLSSISCCICCRIQLLGFSMMIPHCEYWCVTGMPVRGRRAQLPLLCPSLWTCTKIPLPALWLSNFCSSLFSLQSKWYHYQGPEHTHRFCCLFLPFPGVQSPGLKASSNMTWPCNLWSDCWRRAKVREGDERHLIGGLWLGSCI